MNKYIDLPKRFYAIAVEAEIKTRMLERSLKKLIPKGKRDEELAEFIVAVAEQNELVLKMLTETKDLLQEIMNDAKAVVKGAELRNQMRDQSETITQLMAYRDDLIKQLNDRQRTS